MSKQHAWASYTHASVADCGIKFMITPLQAQEMVERLDRNRKRCVIEPSEWDGTDGVEHERTLHNSISAYCKNKQWMFWHGSMAHKAMRTIGEPDFTILADRGRVFFIEAKSRTGKLTTEQQGTILAAKILGHEIHVVRSVTEFIALVQNKA